MTKKIDSILKEVLKKVEPSKEELDLIKNSLKEFLKKVEDRIKNKKIDVEIFVGGSYAKKTLIKKDEYDLDIFFRFNGNVEGISEITEKILEGLGKVLVIHGSRDYFRVVISPGFFIEVVPVKKIKKLKEAENITDLSYSHVNYIKRKLKSKKILDEIRIAKAFCYATQCYGAESYIKGFSGYALELLVYYYGGFLKFIKAVDRMKEKTVIDIEKHFKNKKQVLMDINSSKLQSPIILIDPTYKQRNALAALSEETFEKFKKACGEFLKNPSIKTFEIKKTDLEKIEKNAKKNKFEFILLEARTEKQEGDIAGSKLLKFYKHLEEEISRFFEVKNKGFNYNTGIWEIPVSRTSKKRKEVQDNKKSARYFFVVKNKKEILINGPDVKDEKNLKAFEKIHKNYFTKKGKIYAKEVVDFSLREFLEKWIKKHKKKIEEMAISEFGVV